MVIPPLLSSDQVFLEKTTVKELKMKKTIVIPAMLAVVCNLSLSFAQFGGSYKWDNPGTYSNGITHYTYHSDLMNVDIGYNIYLPPDYNNSSDRYPVIYSLHGMGGNEGGNCGTMGGVLQDGITKKDFPPVIMVFVNGRGNTFYSDSKDGKIKCESSIIKELIPYIDATYRTKADRTQRAIEGMSMGGFGSLMLGFKYPELFQSIATYDAALVTWDTLRDQTFDRSIPNDIFGGDGNYFKENSYPFTFAKKNAAKIKELGIKVRISTGDNDLGMGPLYYYNLAMRDTLKALGISVECNVIPGGTHGSSMSGSNCKTNMIFHTTNFKNAETHIYNSLFPVQSKNITNTGAFTFSTYSSSRIPEQWRRSVNTANLYDLSGRNLGQMITGDINCVDSKKMQERFGSGMYLLKAKK